MAWYERLIDPLPEEPVVRPPDKVFAFYVAFIKPAKWLILAVLVLSFFASIIEMGLLVFMGWLVDWMTTTPPAEFFARYGWQLIGMAAVVLVLRPTIGLLNVEGYYDSLLAMIAHGVKETFIKAEYLTLFVSAASPR